jgi:hypothetical protein
MYVYVERGILAVHNPETGVLEFLTMGEAALAGQMFQEDQPKFVGTRRQAERLYDPSLMQIRVALDLDPSVEAEDTRGHEVRYALPSGLPNAPKAGFTTDVESLLRVLGLLISSSPRVLVPSSLKTMRSLLLRSQSCSRLKTSMYI